MIAAQIVVRRPIERDSLAHGCVVSGIELSVRTAFPKAISAAGCPKSVYQSDGIVDRPRKALAANALACKSARQKGSDSCEI